MIKEIDTQFNTTTVRVIKVEGQDTALAISVEDSTIIAYLSTQQKQELIEALQETQ